jgi:hypothetical protein
MKTKTFIYLAFIFFLLSCEKEVELIVHSSEPQYVIEALLASESHATVRIVQSKNYGEDNQYPPVQGATVVLSDNTGETELLELTPAGFYESKIIRGIQGNTYYLNVVLDGKEYTSTATMPYAVPIKELVMDNTLMGAFPKISYDDPAGIANYYRAILYINGKRMPNMEIMDDKDTDGKTNSSLVLFDLDYNNGKEIEKGDRVLIEMQCLDKGTYTYFETLNRINTSLANPASNITGGALGYFGVYTSDRKEIIADWD